MQDLPLCIDLIINRVIQSVPGVKVTISGFNSRADSESNLHMQMGPIRNSSGVMNFLNF